MKPDDLLPSACIPFIPHTERNEQLKIYGEAPDTVSVSIVTLAPEALKPAAGPAGRLSLTKGRRYVKVVEFSTP